MPTHTGFVYGSARHMYWVIAKIDARISRRRPPLVTSLNTPKTPRVGVCTFHQLSE